MGRWGWSEPGRSVAAGSAPRWELKKPLGDLVLAAERSFGDGKVVVLGDAGCLSNDVLPTSYEFVGRLLSSLACKDSSDPALLGRQLLGLCAILLIGLLLARGPRLASVAVAAIILSSRLLSASPVSGMGFEFDAITAVVIGGTSLRGGKGSIYNTIIGVLLLAIIINALTLYNIPYAFQNISKGLLIILAIAADVRGRGKFGG